MLGVRNLSRWVVIAALAATSAALTARAAVPATEPTLDELKAKLPSASVADKTHLCVQIAQLQLTETDKLYAGEEPEKAQPALTDVITFSEKARDYAIESHKNQKQTEIAIRGMARRLTDLMHTLPHDLQPPVRDAITRLQRVRDDLLFAMFPKGAK
jgi:hypothetical protein